MDYTIENFDWEFYVNRYKDLRDAGILTKKKAWYHWCTYGCKENRVHANLNNKNININKKNNIIIIKNESFNITKTNIGNNSNKYNNLKVVVSSTQYPGYGGSATNAYNIIKFLRSKNIMCVGIFFHNNLDVEYNPDKLDGIFIYKYNYRKEEILNNISYYLDGFPDICLCKNWLAPVFCKKIFNCFTVYLVAGISHFQKYYYNNNALELLDKKFKINEIIPKEEECCEVSDLIILNSQLSYGLFYKIYEKNFANKIYNTVIDTTKCNNDINYDIYCENKTYDILVCCSRLDRKDKNNLFLIDVLKNSELTKYRKIFIGNNYNSFLNIENSFFTGLLSHQKTLEIMKKCKILLFPSKFDANSNTVRECLNRNCLPIITSNIGYSECFPSHLVCNSFNTDIWIKKTKYVLNNYDDIVNNKNKIIFNSPNIDHFINYFVKRRKRILITSTQYPYFGGGGTNSYKITSYLRTIGHTSCCLYFENNMNNYIDPDQISGVFYINRKLLNKEEIKTQICNYLGGEPDIILGFNYIAPVSSRDIFPEAKIIYMSIGLPLLTLGGGSLVNKNISAVQYLKDYNLFNPTFVENIKNKEIRAINSSDIVLPNSLVLEKILHNMYPEHKSKINNYIDYTYFTVKNSLNMIPKKIEKEYDIVIISSSWDRKVKNGKFAGSIFSDRQLDKYNKIVIGSDYDMFKDINNCNCVGLLKNNEVLNYLNKTKLLIIPSLFDANPNVLREALINKCNVLLSKNVGFSEALAPKFVMDDCYDVNNWVVRTKKLIDEYDANDNFEIKFQDVDFLFDKMISNL